MSGGSRIIFHIDVNSAFLSWSALEELKKNPSAVDLRTIPSAVGGDVEQRRGVITAKSIPAKKYGVTTGEPVVKALQKCPDLVLVRSDFTAYRRYSRAFIALLLEYSDQIQQVSIDEAWLDVTEEAKDIKGALALADTIRRDVRTRLRFTVNIGISTNKLLAKMASDFTKPDRVHTLLPHEVPEKMWPLPVRELYGCGGATAERLNKIGIRTIGEAAKTDPAVLISLLGEKGGLYIYESANGRGSDRVETEQREAKSCSNEVTTPRDITADNFSRDAQPIVNHLSEKVASRLVHDGYTASVITVSVKTDSFRRHSRQTRLPSPTNDSAQIRDVAWRLLSELLLGSKDSKGLFAAGNAIRLVGVGASALDRGGFRQISLTEAMRTIDEERTEEKIRAASAEKQRRLIAMQNQIRDKFGDHAIRKGADTQSSTASGDPKP